MSLINDALKQATRSPRASSIGASASPAGVLRPVEEPRSGGLSVVLPIVLVVMLAASGWFLWQWWQSGKAGTSFNLSSLVQSAKSLIPDNKAAPAPKSESNSATPAAATKPENAKSEGNFITRVFNKQSAAATDPSRPIVFPPVKVQGIYYRVGDSTVLINGKNLNEGEAIDGVTIAKIDRQTVTLEFQGQTKEIKLR